MNVVVRPKRIALTLIFISIGLALTSLAGQVSKYFLGRGNVLGLVGLFNVNAENNIPTVYSAFILFLSSILLALIASAKQRYRAGFTVYWWVLSILFFYLSCDELFEIHETVNTSLGEGLGLWNSGPWDILNSVILFVFIAFYTRFFLHLPWSMRRLLLISGSLFVLGGLGIELIGERFLYSVYHQPIFMAEVITTIEELLEMLGTVGFIYALLLYIHVLGGITICIGESYTANIQESIKYYSNFK